MRLLHHYLVPLIFVCATLVAQEEVDRLREEATAILSAYQKSQSAVTHDEYAAAILKLEKALNILEKAGDTNSTLAQDLSSQYFWSKRFSNIHIMNALEKLRKQGNVVPPTRFDLKPAKKDPNAPDAEAADPQALAKKAYEEATAYAQEKKNDAMAVAKRFFLVAGLYPGTDYGMKAIAAARDALLRFANQGGAKLDELPDSPEMEKVKRGEALAAEGKYRDAFPLFQSALREKESAAAHRRLGRAYFTCAQKLREEILATWDELKPKMEEAKSRAFVMNGKDRVFDPNHPAMQAVRAEQSKLAAKVAEAKTNYNGAKRAFEAVLRLSEGNKDLEAAAYIALGLRGSEQVPSAKTQLEKVATAYESKNDYERILHEYCKLELEALTAK